ncbi:pre-mRNA-splicing factor 38B [Lingula anatina]|uniref:Pre-mRNA-splicing factor 38 n=1 Tax=Lingula anatina TaxID=7574 RepID=A0A1S3JG45_LINAN|nr:pre-mRNA-splicing factor 38B [Lingula anatina]|eukprot:XP_013409372.1 pre-mRNA-splicing factor 38B [Lingula anatina]
MAPTSALPIWGNEATMNLNSLILTNIQSSPYFKVNLYELKTYHEVIDEIYYKVTHLEPWEKGSRKTAGQTGMCGGVRGVGAGGIVSSAYCLLYKLYTLKLTRKQVNGLITHTDSPYIRGLGFMYLRYTQPPADLWEWYEPYLDDEEEIDVKAGTGHVMTIGEMLRQWLTKLEWYCTLFPRIPVPVQKSNQQRLRERQFARPVRVAGGEEEEEQSADRRIPDEDVSFGEAARMSRVRRSKTPERRPRSPFRKKSPPFDIAKEIEKERDRQQRDGHSRSRDGREHQRSRSKDRHRDDYRSRHRSRSRERVKSSRHRSRSKERSKHRSRSKERSKHRSRSKERSRHRSRSKDRTRHRSRSKEKSKHRSRSKDRKRSRTPDRKYSKHEKSSKHRRSRSKETSFERDLRKEKERQAEKNS